MTVILTELLEKEFKDDDEIFSSTFTQFWGKEKIIRKFLATNDGKCSKCQMYPSIKEQNFLSIKVDVPDLNVSVELSSLVQRYFSENMDEMVMRCANCCKHAQNCPQTGICRPRPAVSQTIITKSPKFLIIHLKQFGLHFGSKTQTTVTPNNKLSLPNEDNFELIAVTSHIGSTSNSGHYVSYVRTGQVWTLCNDNRLCEVAEASVKTRDNYVYIYQKVVITNDEEKYPAFVPQAYWQELESWQSVPHGCHVRVDFETGKRFARIEKQNTPQTHIETTSDLLAKKSKLVKNNPDIKVQKRKDDKTDSEENYKMKHQKKAHSAMNKKKQTSDLSSELQKCGNCDRNVLDLSKHLESKVCNGSNKNEKSISCRGCNKQYLRLLPKKKKKNGKGCRVLYTDKELEQPSKLKKYDDENRGEINEKKRKRK